MSKIQKQRCSTALYNRNQSSRISPNQILKYDSNISQKANSPKNIQLPVLQSNDSRQKSRVKPTFFSSNFKQYFQPVSVATTNFISHNCSIESIQSILPQNTITILEKSLFAFSQSLSNENLTLVHDQNVHRQTATISNSTKKNGEFFILKWESFILHFIHIWNSGHKLLVESISSKLDILNTIIATIETALRQNKKRTLNNDIRKQGDTNTIHDQVLQSCQNYKIILDSLNSNFERLFSLLNNKKLWIEPSSQANQQSLIEMNHSSNKLIKINSDIQSNKNNLEDQYFSDNKLIKTNSVASINAVTPSSEVKLTANSAIITEIADTLCGSTRDLSRKINESFLHEFSQLGLQDVMMLRTAAVSACSDLIREFRSSIVYDDDLLQMSFSISNFKNYLREVCLQNGLKCASDRYEFKYEEIVENDQQVTPSSEVDLFENCTLIELIQKSILWYLKSCQQENIDKGHQIQQLVLKRFEKYEVEMNNKIKEQQKQIEQIQADLARQKAKELDLVQSQNQIKNELTTQQTKEQDLIQIKIELEKEYQNTLKEKEERLELEKNQLANEHQLTMIQLQNEISRLKEQNEDLNKIYKSEQNKFEEEIKRIQKINKTLEGKIKILNKNPENFDKSVQTEDNEEKITKALQRIDHFRKSFQFIIGSYHNHIDKTDEEIIHAIILNYKTVFENKQELEKKANSLSIDLSNKTDELQSKTKQIFDIQSHIINIESNLYHILKPSDIDNKAIENHLECIKRIQSYLDLLKDMSTSYIQLLNKNDSKDDGLFQNSIKLINKMHNNEMELNELYQLFEINPNENNHIQDTVKHIKQKMNSQDNFLDEIDCIIEKNDKITDSIEKIINSLEVQKCDQIEFNQQSKENIAVYAVNAIVKSIHRNTNKCASPLLSLDAYFEKQNQFLQSIDLKLVNCLNELQLSLSTSPSNVFEAIHFKIDFLFSQLKAITTELKAKNEEIDHMNKEKIKNANSISTPTNIPFVTLRRIDGYLCRALGIQTVRDTDLQTHVFDLIESVEKRLIKFSTFSHRISELFHLDSSIPLDDILKSIQDSLKQNANQLKNNSVDKAIGDLFSPIFDLIEVSNKNDPCIYIPEIIQSYRDLYNSISCLKPLGVILNKIFDEFDSRTISSFDTSSKNFRVYNGYILELRTVLQSMYPSHVDSLVYSVTSKLVTLVTSLTTVLASIADSSTKK